jgi:hypothetical protein
MLRFVAEDVEELQRNKYRYCIHKDELVVGIGRPWDNKVVVKRTANSAYPRVISNLGSLTDVDETRIAINMIRFMNHYARSIAERAKIIKFFQNGNYTTPTQIMNGGGNLTLPGMEAFKDLGGGKIGTDRFMPLMNDHFAVGFANTLGWAHANSGDTMTSVMIGGLRTVMNGDFEIFPGDLVQFYWSFERDDFLQTGQRKPYLNIFDPDGTVHNIDPSAVPGGATRKRNAAGQLIDPTWSTPADAQVRQAHYNLSYGQKKDKVKVVAKIKPYFKDEVNPRLMDWYRVFGVAIASARPNEMCDIKIARQSI